MYSSYWKYFKYCTAPYFSPHSSKYWWLFMGFWHTFKPNLIIFSSTILHFLPLPSQFVIYSSLSPLMSYCLTLVVALPFVFPISPSISPYNSNNHNKATQSESCQRWLQLQLLINLVCDSTTQITAENCEKWGVVDGITVVTPVSMGSVSWKCLGFIDNL